MTIILFKNLKHIRLSLAGKNIVFAGGTFDLFHRGHVDALKALRRYGDVVVIAVSSDRRVAQRKGKLRPILPQSERLALIDSIRYVDYSLIAPPPRVGLQVPTVRILRALRPAIFVTSDKKWLLFRNKIDRLGVRLKVVPRGHINSTTAIIRRIITRYRLAA